jgi:hypothetical protein
MTLRQQMQKEVDKMGNPPLSTFGEMAKNQWLKHRPKLARELLKEGCLKLAAIIAQEGMKDQIAEQVEAGVNPLTAREVAIHEWVYLENQEDPSPAEAIQQKKDQAENQIDVFLTMLGSLKDKQDEQH